MRIIYDTCRLYIYIYSRLEVLMANTIGGGGGGGEGCVQLGYK